MKTLSQALEPTLKAAKPTTDTHLPSQLSSTNAGGLTITTPQQLTEKTPDENNQSLAHYLKSTLKLPLNINKRTRYTEYGAEFIPEVSCGAITAEERRQAEIAIAQYNTPLPNEEIAKLVARLQMIAPERSKGTVDIKARLAIWIEELSQYPADVTTTALKMRYRWFPSLAEVLENCDNEVAYRKLLERGIRVAAWR